MKDFPKPLSKQKRGETIRESFPFTSRDRFFFPFSDKFCLLLERHFLSFDLERLISACVGQVDEDDEGVGDLPPLDQNGDGHDHGRVHHGDLVVCK